MFYEIGFPACNFVSSHCILCVSYFLKIVYYVFNFSSWQILQNYFMFLFQFYSVQFFFRLGWSWSFNCKILRVIVFGPTHIILEYSLHIFVFLLKCSWISSKNKGYHVSVNVRFSLGMLINLIHQVVVSLNGIFITNFDNCLVEIPILFY